MPISGDFGQCSKFAASKIGDQIKYPKPTKVNIRHWTNWEKSVSANCTSPNVYCRLIRNTRETPQLSRFVSRCRLINVLHFRNKCSLYAALQVLYQFNQQQPSTSVVMYWPRILTLIALNLSAPLYSIIALLYFHTAAFSDVFGNETFSNVSIKTHHRFQFSTFDRRDFGLRNQRRPFVVQSETAIPNVHRFNMGRQVWKLS